MSSAFNKRALILKKTQYGESDLILKVLTSEGEKIDAMAKGALRSKKRFGGGVLDPMNYVELSFAPQKISSDLKYLNEARILYDFVALRSDYDKIKLGLYFLKVLYKVELESGSSYAFDLLLHALRAIETSQHLNILKGQFEFKFLFKQGVLLLDAQTSYFIKSSLYESLDLMKHKEVAANLEGLLRRSSYEMENYFEQFLELQ